MEPPYRTPAAAPPDDAPESDPPGSFRPRSSRVLGALARLSEARGAVDASSELSSRAATARSSESRAIGRCLAGNHALVAGDLAFAEVAYGVWLSRAHDAEPSDRDRVEVLAGLAAIASAREDRELAGRHLFEATRYGPRALHPDSAVASLLALAATWLRVGVLEGARTLLRQARDAARTDGERAAVDVGIAEYSLARSALEPASDAVARARDVYDRSGAGAAAERVSLWIARGRVLHVSGNLAAAEDALLLALETAHAFAPRPRIAEAEATAYLALVQFRQGRLDDALAGQRLARDLAVGAVPSGWAVHVPVLMASMHLLRAIDAPEAHRVEAALASIVASHRADDTLR